MKILAVGDSYMPSRYFRRAMEPLAARNEIAFLDVDPDWSWIPSTASERGLTEYQGSPDEIAAQMSGVEVLVVQGAPVTEDVLTASQVLSLVCCARGGPVNVDVDALKRLGIPLFTTPGKNAEAVADLTVALLVMLARGLPTAQRFLSEGGVLKDNWEGARFIGHDLRRHELGLVGYGQIGRRVAKRATAFGMQVLAFDPFVDGVDDPGVEYVPEFAELLRRSDFISLHARATKDNDKLFNAHVIGMMREGSCLVNTARDSLIDEDALDQALSSGHLSGVALDVFRPQSTSGRHPLLRHPNVILTPHIGGATEETLLQGAEMITAEIERVVQSRLNQASSTSAEAAPA